MCAATLCTFGKHPGWNDHMECLGLETDVLVSFHQDLYKQGIGRNIGTWEELAKRNKTNLLPFNHDVIWQKNEHIILARLWHSRDGKGRDRYPMVTCVHTCSIPLWLLLKDIHPILLETERKYVAATSASEVLSIFNYAKEQVKNWRRDFQGTIPSAHELSPFEAFERLKHINPAQCDLNGFSRILFAVENNLSFKSGSITSTVSASLYPIRISINSSSFKDSAVVWTSFLNSQFKKETIRIYLFPTNFSWCDLIVGEPFVQEYNCIKLPLENIPLIFNDNSIVVGERFMHRIEANIEAINQKKNKEISSFIKIGKRTGESQVVHRTMKIKGLIADSLRGEKESIDKTLIKKLILTVGLAVILLAVAVFMLMKEEPVKPITKANNSNSQKASGTEQELSSFDPEVWRNLCLEYHTWFGSFYNDLNATRKEKWSEDEELRKAIKLLEITSTSNKKIDPIKIAETKGNYRFLAENPPSSTMNPEVRGQIEDADKLVQQIKQILTAKQENVQKFLQDLHQRYDTLGWLGPLQILSKIREMIPRNDQALSSEISIILDNYFEVRDKLEEIDKLSENVQTHLEIISTSGDAILSNVGHYVESQLREVNDLEEFKTTLNTLASVDHIITELAAFVKNQWNSTRINIDLFNSDSKVHRYFDGRINESILAAWLNEVQNYRWLDSSIEKTKDLWQKDLAIIENKILELSERNSNEIGNFKEQLETLKQEGQLRLPYVQKYKAELERLVEIVNKKIKNLNQNIDIEIITHSEDPCVWLKKIKSFQFEQSVALQEIWETKRLEILGETTCEQLGTNQFRYAQLRAKGDGLRHFLIQLDQAFASSTEINILKPKNWHAQVFDFIRTKREEVIKRVISLIKWNDGTLDKGFEEFIREKDQAFLYEGYLEWLKKIKQAFADFRIIDQKLDQGYLLNEKIQYHETISTVDSLFNLWFQSDFFSRNPGLNSIMSPIFSRLAQLQEILKEKNIKKLTDYALDSKSTLVNTLASWRRLGHMDWPIKSDDRAVMKSIATHLATLINTLEDEARIPELRGLVKQEKIVYELKYFEATIGTTINDIEFGLEEVSNADPNSQEKVNSIKKELTKIIQLKINKVNDLKDRVPTQKDLTAFSKSLAQLYQLRKKVDELKDPWTEIERLEKLNEISDNYMGLNEIWKIHRDQVLHDFKKERQRKILTKAVQIKVKLENAYDILKKLATDVDFNSNICHKTPQLEQQPWKGEIETIINEKRKSMILEYLHHTDPDVNKIKERFDSWRHTLCGLALKFNDLKKHLDGGFTLRSKWDSGTTDTLYEKWRTQLSSFNELRTVVNQIGDRVKKLRSIATINGRDLINQELAQNYSQPEILMTLWEKTRLLENWPMSIDELNQEVTLRKKVNELIASVKNIDRNFAARIQNELTKEKENRWLICLEQLTQNSDIEKALALKDQFTTPSKTLSPHIQYNLLLYKIKQAKLEEVDDERIKEICNDFINNVKVKFQLQGNQNIDAFLSELESAISGETRASKSDFKKIGPASSLVGNELDIEVVNKGELIKYKWANAILGENSFQFIRISPEEQGVRPFYLCSTEVSLGVFIQVISRADKWQDIHVFISEEAMDPLRPGPWLWDYDEENQKMVIREEWVNIPSLSQSADYYPEGSGKDIPSESHPMHHISPHLAIYFSKLLGCRMPSPAEWKIANSLYPSQNSNLRDKTWETHKQHVYSLEQKRLSVFYSDSNIFWPSNWGPASRKIGKDAEGQNSYNDGALWFNLVNSSSNGPFSHLIGNVSEYVFKHPMIFDEEFNMNSTISAEKINQFVKEHASNFFVIGAAALSSPEIMSSQAYPVDTSNQRLSYSDVGIRLAFTAPNLSLSAQVKAIVQKQKYLLN